MIKKTKTCIKVIRCEKCKSTRYCSTFCRDKHFSSHKKLCGVIQELEAIENSKKNGVFSPRTRTNESAESLDPVNRGKTYFEVFVE